MSTAVGQLPEKDVSVQKTKSSQAITHYALSQTKGAIIRWNHHRGDDPGGKRVGVLGVFGALLLLVIMGEMVKPASLSEGEVPRINENTIRKKG